MSESICIAVDARGGDKGPRGAIEGAYLFWRERKNVSYIFHGREADIAPLIKQFPELEKISRIAPSEVVISMEEKPSQALRRGPLGVVVGALPCSLAGLLACSGPCVHAAASLLANSSR